MNDSSLIAHPSSFIINKMAETKPKPTAEEQAIAEQQAQTKAILDTQAELADTRSLVDKLQGELSQKDIEIKQLSDALAEAEELVTEQQAALSAPADDTEKVYVTHGKQKYQVVTPRFRLDGTDYAAADLKENKKLLARLIERRSSVLKAIK